jgi:hypothetical protein
LQRYPPIIETLVYKNHLQFSTVFQPKKVISMQPASTHIRSGLHILLYFLLPSLYNSERDAMDIKGVIQSKKTFDMCYQTLREPHRHQQNLDRTVRCMIFLMNSYSGTPGGH